MHAHNCGTWEVETEQESRVILSYITRGLHDRLSQSKTMATKQHIDFMIDILRLLGKLFDLRILETHKSGTPRDQKAFGD